MSHSRFHCAYSVYLDMHGLIFETSMWQLAGSTRMRAESITTDEGWKMEAYKCWRRMLVKAFNINIDDFIEEKRWAKLKLWSCEEKTFVETIPAKNQPTNHRKTSIFL